MDFFGTPWKELALAHIEQFLDGEIDEGITWETKGTKRPTLHQTRKAVCGLANQQGGFFIVGVRQGEELGTWIVDGINFGGDEPRRFLSDVIGGGLDPVPAFDITPFPVEDGKHVVVVKVEPVAVPPCITIAGQIYERLPGKTEPVNATALARLRGAGKQARDLAEATAMQAVGQRVSFRASVPYFVLSFAIAPTGRAIDIGGRLFTESFEKELDAIYQGLPIAPLFGRGRSPYAHETNMRGSTFVVSAIERAREEWSLRARWDGSVDLVLTASGEKGAERESIPADAVFDDAVRPAANAACRLVETLGGFGPAHVVLQMSSARFFLEQGKYREPIPRGTSTTARTWTDDNGTLSDAAMERMKRDILRACGIRAYEPEASA